MMFVSLLRRLLPSAPARCSDSRMWASASPPGARAAAGLVGYAFQRLPEHYRLDIRTNGLGSSDVLGIFLV